MTEKKSKPKKGIIFAIVSFSSFFIIPVMLMFSIIMFLLSNSNFYTGIIENANLLSAYVNAQSVQTDKKIQYEIEKEVGLEKHKEELKKITIDYNYLKDAFFKINRQLEYESLEKQEEELSDLSWENVKNLYASEDDFEKSRDSEVVKIKKKIKEIKKYRDKNEDAIEALEDKYDDAKSKYKDGISTLEDKKEDALDIVEKHKNSISGKMHSGLKILEKPLSKILNEKFINVTIKEEIEKLLNFITTYYEQQDKGNIYYVTSKTSGVALKKIRIKLPDFKVSLWVDDNAYGVKKKRHLLSQVFVDEIRKQSFFEAKDTYLTLFKISDSSITEYFAERYIKKYGLTIDNGIIRMKGAVLEGEKAVYFQKMMLLFTLSKYAFYVTGGFILLFLLFVMFSSVGKIRKLKALHRNFFYPSTIIILVSLASIAASRFVLDHYPDLVSSIQVRSYMKSSLFNTSRYVFIPIIIVYFGMIFLGLIFKKLKQRAEKKVS